MLEISDYWRGIIMGLPGYDPIATAEPGDWFDADAAQRAVEFFPECLTHIEGATAGERFNLEPWEMAIVGNLFGWKREDGSRRYREVLIYIARKNGKTPLAAGIALYILFCDNEIGAQCVCAAADAEQATYLFRHACGMVDAEPELRNRSQIYRGVGQRTILNGELNGTLKVVSSDAATKHGGNLHLGIVDELHAQTNRDLVDVLITSMASTTRRQPLMIYLTTADFDRPSICNETYDYACNVRDGKLADHAYLPCIWETAAATKTRKADDWRLPATWRKANPNIGVSVSEEYLARECQKAIDNVELQPRFQRMHLNLRTTRDVLFLDMDKWDACVADLLDLAGEPCWVGLDLSTTIDMTAAVAWFPDHKAFIGKYWLPEETAKEIARKHGTPVATFVEAGLLELTPGNEVDYSAIRKYVVGLNDTYSVQKLVYDPWNATDLTQQVEVAGIERVLFRQILSNFTGPCKRLEAMVVTGDLNHGGDIVMRWAASATKVWHDRNDNIRPVKPEREKSGLRIDPVVALLMGIGGAMAESGGESSYETEGLVVE